MSLFRGFTQQQGFKPITVHDPADKILQQGRQKTRHMQKTLDWYKRETQKLVNTMKYNASVEEKNFKDNFELDQEFGDILAKARMKKWKILADNERVEADSRDRDLKSILAFTQTGLQTFQKMKEQQAADSMEWAELMKLNNGVGSYKANIIRSIDDAEFEDKSKHIELQKRYSLEGVSWEAMRQIRKANGGQIHALNKLGARQLAQDMQHIIRDNADKKYEIAPGYEVSLNEVRNYQDARFILDKMLLEERAKAKERGGWKDPKLWIASGADKIWHQISAGYMRDWDSRQEQIEDQENQDDRFVQIESAVTATPDPATGIQVGVKGLIGVIEQSAIEKALLNSSGKRNKPTGEEWQEAYNQYGKDILEGVEQGKLNPSDFTGIDSLLVPHHGSKTPVLLSAASSYLGNAVIPKLLKAQGERKDQLFTNSNRQARTADAQALKDMKDEFRDNPTNFDLKQMTSVAPRLSISSKTFLILES